MAKYRLLSLDELKELEKEFVNYLILNGIAADDWQKLKTEDVSRAEGIIDLFSDVVFESILRKIEFLEKRDPTEVQTFHCLGEKLVVVGMKSTKETGVDFTDPNFVKAAAVQPPDALQVYTTEKVYNKEREVELFEMLNSGCVISDGKLFKLLCLSLPQKN
jgi:hypothetical protein